MNNKILAAVVVAIVSVVSVATAQENTVQTHEISVQGTGFFTKDSSGNGVNQHVTDTGGFVISYRYHFNNWLAADASYGYDRNTQQNFTKPLGPSSSPFPIGSSDLVPTFSQVLEP